MLAGKRFADVIPEVRTPLLSPNKTAHSGFETQRRRHQKSKTDVSVAPEKGIMYYKNLKKKFAFKTVLPGFRPLYNRSSFIHPSQS